MSNHVVPVVRINEILKHPNADALGLVHIGGFQVVVRLEQFKAGDLAVYIPPDSIVPERSQFSFVWEKDGSGQPRALVAGEPVPEKYRRVTVRKFRKEWSEGLLLPVTDFGELFLDGDFKVQFLHKEGDDVAERLGITHWNPPEDQEEREREASVKQSKTMPRSWKGWYHFLKNWSIKILSFGQIDPWGNTGGGNEKAPRNTPPIYDVENFKHHRDVFVEGEEVVVTEKIHGSNARYLYSDQVFTYGHIYAGSRKLWKSETSNSVWRQILKTNHAIGEWCAKHPGYTLYGEAVPTQGGFEYGHKKENPWLYVFDILDPKGNWVPYDEARHMTGGYDIEWAPLLYHGPYDYEKIKALVDGPTKTGGNHIREGIVIHTYPERHVHGLGRAQLKIVSNKYLEKEQ